MSESPSHLKYPISLNSGTEEWFFLNCPRCGSPVSGPPEREWTFQKYHVSRFRCDNGDKFNLYRGGSKTFTIPRMPVVRSGCPRCRTENPDYAVYCKNCGNKL